MSARPFQVGDRVQAVLLDEARTELPGMEGIVLPVSEWPVTFPEQWTDENTIIVRWDDHEGHMRYTPYAHDVAARVLRVLADDVVTEAESLAEVQAPAEIAADQIWVDRSDARWQVWGIYDGMVELDRVPGFQSRSVSPADLRDGYVLEATEAVGEVSPDPVGALTGEPHSLRGAS